MSEERERLKETYKQHYRQILEHKRQLAAAERKSKILKSIEAIDTRPVIEGFQDALGAVREQIAKAEARLEVWLDDRDDTAAAQSGVSQEEVEAFERTQNARELLSKIKSEMGTIERKLDETAAGLGASKTIADTDRAHAKAGNPNAATTPEPDPVKLSAEAVKTIGRATKP
ncbi:hypothetical protein CYPRO_1666 [Cyclonatronum proteinivorum]|uniref:Uncharacterized protein n=1 Tax=Cyclonatronum proteinivorum TaxID=1457365 RepID=A0A345UKB5_9BACT|nr:hypothetical protein [Cyclonatronum proteinivorum]AXJ00917.1 hypothetical protein CYPRO_1666 [Cyclonatronum proteinivorum]